MAPTSDKKGRSPAAGDIGGKGALRRLGTNSGKLLGGRVANAVMGLATTALAIRTLGMETFGVLMLVHTVALVSGTLFDFRLGHSVLAYGASRLERDDVPGFRRLIAFALRLQCAALGIAIPVSAVGVFWLGPWLEWPQASLPGAALYMAVIAFQPNGRLEAGILRLFNRFDHIALLHSAQSLARLVGTALLWQAGLGDLSLFLALWFGAAMIHSAGIAGSAYRELRIRGLLPQRILRPGPAADMETGLWRFVCLTNLNATLGLTFSRLGTLLVGGLFGPAQAGLFHVADRLAKAVGGAVKAVRPAIGPEIAQLLATGSQRRLRRLMLRAMAIGAGTAVGLLAVIALAGPSLLELMGGDQARSAYVLMLLLAVATLTTLATFPFTPLLNAAGRPGRITISNAIATVIYLVALLTLAPRIGLEAAGVAAVLAIIGRRAIEATAVFPLLRSAPDVE